MAAYLLKTISLTIAFYLILLKGFVKVQLPIYLLLMVITFIHRLFRKDVLPGVMRRWMLERFDLKKYHVVEKKLSISDVYDADEFFLTNAISHLRWVKKFRDKNYKNKKIKEIYNHTPSNHLAEKFVIYCLLEAACYLHLCLITIKADAKS